MTTESPSYRGYRFPVSIISHAVWLYHRFGLSFRDVEDLLAERGVTVTYESIRRWCRSDSVSARCAASSPPRRYSASRLFTASCRISSERAATDCGPFTTGS